MERRQTKVRRLEGVFDRGWYLNICIINPISAELSEEREKNAASPVEKKKKQRENIVNSWHCSEYSSSSFSVKTQVGNPYLRGN